MKFRAALIALSLAAAAPVALAAASPGRLEFEVLRNGSSFGRHVIEVTRTEAGLSVRNNVALRVNVGPITAFRFEQACTETWTGARVQSVQCSTLKDGRRTEVNVRRGQGGLVARAGETARTFSADAAPTTWWTRTALQGDSFIDTQTGQPIALAVERKGRETINVGGRALVAERFHVRGSEELDLWYDAEGRWVACAFTARGQRIEYRLVSPIESAPT